MSKALDMERELVKKLEEEEKQSKVQLSTLNPGDVFKIGEHDFIVLMQCGEETAVISKGFMAENVKFDEDSRNYKESNLKKVIENLIQPVIEVEVGSKNLIEHEVDLTSVDMGYWNRIRKDFPEVFESRAKLERTVGHSMLKDKNGPVYLDELNPDRGDMNTEIFPECGIMCYLAQK